MRKLGYALSITLFLLFSTTIVFAADPAGAGPAINFGGLPANFEGNPHLFWDVGTKAGPGNRSPAYHVFWDEFRDHTILHWMREKNLDAVTFKAHELTSPNPEAEAAALLKAWTRAETDGVGVKVHAARYVSASGNRKFLVIAMQNYEATPMCQGRIIYYRMAGYAIGDQALLAQIPLEKRMDVALRIYRAYSHLVDTNGGNVLVRMLEMAPGATPPENAVPLGGNKYLQAAAIDLAPGQPAFNKVDLTRPPITGPTTEAHSIANSLAREFGLNADDFKAKANAYNRRGEINPMFQMSEGPFKLSSRTGPTIQSQIRGHRIAPPYLPRGPMFAGTAGVTFPSALLVAARIVDNGNNTSRRMNTRESIFEMRNWLYQANVCAVGGFDTFCEKELETALKDPQQRAAAIANLKQVFAAMGEERYKNHVDRAVEAFVQGNFATIEAMPWEPEPGKTCLKQVLKFGAQYLCEAVYFNYYIEELKKQSGCDALTAQEYGKYVNVNLAYQDPSWFNEQVDKLRPYDNLLAVVDLDTGAIYGTDKEDKRDAKPLAVFDPAKPAQDIFLKFTMAVLGTKLYRYRLSPEDAAKVARLMALREKCKIVTKTPPQLPPPPPPQLPPAGRDAEACTDSLRLVDEQLKKLEDPVRCEGVVEDIRDVIRILVLSTNELTDDKTPCEKHPITKAQRDRMKQRHNRIAKIFGELNKTPGGVAASLCSSIQEVMP